MTAPTTSRKSTTPAKLLLDRALVVGTLVLPFVVYVLSLPEGVTFADGADFASAAVNLGVPHSSGYPLFTLLGHFATTLLPWMSAARAVALVCVLCSTLTLAVGLHLLALLGVRRWIAAAILLAYAFTVETWVQARTVEVYGLHTLLVALVLLHLLRWLEDHEDRRLLLVSWLLGFSFTNHLTTALLFPTLAVVFFLHWHHRRSFAATADLLVRCTARIGPPLLLYLYLPLTASFPDGRKFCWGDPRTVENFLRQVSGIDFLRLYTSDEPHSAWLRLLEFINYQYDQFYFPGAFFAALGILHLVLRRPLVVLLLALFYLTQVLYTAVYQIQDIHGYYLPLLLLFALAAGTGVEWLLRVRIPLAVRNNRWMGALFVGLLFVYPGYLLYSNRFVAYVGNRAESFSRIAWRNLPPGGLDLNGKSELLFPMWYQTYHVEPRIDRAVLSTDFLVCCSWYRDFLRRTLPTLDLPSEEELEGRYLELFDDVILPNARHFTFHSSGFITRPYHPDWVFVNQGLLSRILPREEATGRVRPTNLIASVFPSHGIEVQLRDRTEWIFPDVATRFRPGETAYCVIQWQHQRLHRTEWRWFGPAGNLVSAESREIPTAEQLSFSVLELTGRRASLPGTWRIEILIDGELQAEVGFEVEEASP